MINLKQIIDITVAKAKTYPAKTEPRIEYNFDLPGLPNIEKDSWHGIPAVVNKKLAKNTANITYKL